MEIKIVLQQNELDVLKKALESYQCSHYKRNICEDLLSLIKHQENKYNEQTNKE